MKALTFQGVEKVRVDEVDPPVLLDDGDVIVRVEASAVCGSDLHVFHGRETGLDVGTILGHELVGDVVETSTTVQRLATGDRVVAPFSTSDVLNLVLSSSQSSDRYLHASTRFFCSSASFLMFWNIIIGNSIRTVRPEDRRPRPGQAPAGRPSFSSGSPCRLL